MLNDEWLQFLSGERVEHPQEKNAEIMMQMVPAMGPLNISTTTKILYTHKSLDIMDLFWRIEIMMYSNIGEGVLKKQMKFVSNTKEDLQQIQEKLSLESSIVNQEIISFHDEFSSRLKFRDIRKISIGICSKDLLTKAKKKSAFYNCVV
jgi:hypothetical protein